MVAAAVVVLLIVDVVLVSPVADAAGTTCGVTDAAAETLAVIDPVCAVPRSICPGVVGADPQAPENQKPPTTEAPTNAPPTPPADPQHPAPHPPPNAAQGTPPS